MSAFQPINYAEALERAKSRPKKSRAVLKKRSDKAISRDVAAGDVFPQKTGKALSRSRIPSRTAGRKGKKTKRVKLMSRKRAITVLDSLTSQIVRLRDGACVLCSTVERLQCGHIFGRRSHAARWDIQPDGNCHTQCAGCNQRHNYDPNRYFSWYQRRFSVDQFNAIYTRWAKGHKFSTPELRAMVTEYQEKLAELQNKL